MMYVKMTKMQYKNISTLCPISGSVDAETLLDYATNPSDYFGKIVYIAKLDDPLVITVPPFTEAGKFYFNEVGVWQPSPFILFPSNPSYDECTSATEVEYGNIDTLCTISGSADAETLLEYASNPSDYFGKIVYVAKLDDPLAVTIPPFTEVGKFYFNEAGVWRPSPFIFFPSNPSFDECEEDE
jgi:hypothetical protein